MPASDPALHCPFCHAEVPARAPECKACHAQKRTRAGMSPTGFRMYVATWAGCTLPIMLLALFAALVPWLPHGEAPGYALALVGAKPLQPVPRCRVEVVDASGRRSELPAAEGCAVGAAGATGPRARAADPDPSVTAHRMAAALHSLLSLGAGTGLSWLLLRQLRRVFLRRIPVSWVRRAAA